MDRVIVFESAEGFEEFARRQWGNESPPTMKSLEILSPQPNGDLEFFLVESDEPNKVEKTMDRIHNVVTIQDQKQILYCTDEGIGIRKSRYGV